jgi:hypothetical protein
MKPKAVQNLMEKEPKKQTKTTKLLPTESFYIFHLSLIVLHFHWFPSF